VGNVARRGCGEAVTVAENVGYKVKCRAQSKALPQSVLVRGTQIGRVIRDLHINEWLRRLLANPAHIRMIKIAAYA
jgi:hypothetical protein